MHRPATDMSLDVEAAGFLLFEEEGRWIIW